MTISVANLLDAYGLMDAEIKALRQQVKIAREALNTLAHQFETGWASGNDAPHVVIQKAEAIALAALKLMDHPDAG